MKSLHEIQSAVSLLGPVELAHFRSWFREYEKTRQQAYPIYEGYITPNSSYVLPKLNTGEVGQAGPWIYDSKELSAHAYEVEGRIVNMTYDENLGRTHILQSDPSKE